MNKSLIHHSSIAQPNLKKYQNLQPNRSSKYRVFGTNITNIPIISSPENENKINKTTYPCVQPVPILVNLEKCANITHLNDSLISANFNSSICELEEEPKAKKPLETLLMGNKEKIKNDTINEYLPEIIQYLHDSEDRNCAHFGYMNMQPDITEKMREILIDWLIEVHLRFKLVPETLYLTINIIDRYLEKSVIARKKLQLVGVASMLIACKYEEIYAPEVKDFVYITDNSYSKEEVLEMEYRILKTLGFNMNSVSTYRFLQYFGEIQPKTKFTAQYLLELCLVKYNMLKYKPSLIAEAALCLSKRLVEKDKNWDLNKNAKYRELELKPIMKEMLIILQMSEKSNLQAVRTKFKSPKYLEVSRLTFKHTK